MKFRFSPGRGPAVAGSAMVATSQTPATLAGLQVLRGGGNAADAAVAAAAVLCVAEPMSTGIGGDAFALVWDGKSALGLDAAGPAPRRGAASPINQAGPCSVTVPGAVAGWQELIARFGRLGLDAALSPAIDLARGGLAAGYHCSKAWQRAEGSPPALGTPPAVGETYRLPELGHSLELIASEGPSVFYEGELAEAITASSWLDESDLSTYTPSWTLPMRASYRGVEVLEMPPPSQGVAALEGLALLDGMEPSLPNQVRAVSLALEDAFARVRDGASVDDLLSEEHLLRRRRAPARLGAEPRAGTVYLCVVDSDGLAVSLIQSLFKSFGAGVVAGQTGIVLNNRIAGFEISGEVEVGRRPYHTIIPAMTMAGGRLHSVFGVMGSFIQAQAHLQLVSAMVDGCLDPQAALERPRFRIENGGVLLEEGLWPQAEELRRRGIAAEPCDDRFKFGGGQAIVVEAGRLLGGSDPRKDGCAVGF